MLVKSLKRPSLIVVMLCLPLTAGALVIHLLQRPAATPTAASAERAPAAISPRLFVLSDEYQKEHLQSYWALQNYRAMCYLHHHKPERSVLNAFTHVSKTAISTPAPAINIRRSVPPASQKLALRAYQRDGRS